MSHRHFCDVAGHEWECEGTAIRHLAGDTEPTVCMCIRHRSEMEDGRDHSECSIELLACPEHREEQLRRINENRTKLTTEETNASDGWDDFFRPMTPEECVKFDAKHLYMDQVIFVGLKNLNTGFDAPGIHHFSPADFGEVITRCEPLHIIPNGIEVFTTGGGFIEVVFAMDDGSPEENSEWARRLVKKYIEEPGITMSATFHVPDSALATSDPESDMGHLVDSDARDCSPKGK